MAFENEETERILHAQECEYIEGRILELEKIRELFESCGDNTEAFLANLSYRKEELEKQIKEFY